MVQIDPEATPKVNFKVIQEGANKVNNLTQAKVC